MRTSAQLARKITWMSSKQSYLTARLLADPDLADDCLRAYAYFRWADDRIDLWLHGRDERMEFIRSQRALVEGLYRGEEPAALLPEEEMLADLIAHSRGRGAGLRSFIDNFMAVLEFDAERAGRPVTRKELVTYTSSLAIAVMDGIQYFIGNGFPYPRNPSRILSVTGAHLTHMLRDLPQDLAGGYFNIPLEVLDLRRMSVADLQSETVRSWVHEQVDLARSCLREGRLYIDSLDILRCKLAGYWYSARFERVLAAIERDGYRLRDEYPECHGAAAWAGTIGLGLSVIISHSMSRLRSLMSVGQARLRGRSEADRI
jgi:phytoene/squalene synthetase